MISAEHWYGVILVASDLSRSNFSFSGKWTQVGQAPREWYSLKVRFSNFLELERSPAIILKSDFSHAGLSVLFAFFLSADVIWVVTQRFNATNIYQLLAPQVALNIQISSEIDLIERLTLAVEPNIGVYTMMIVIIIFLLTELSAK